MTLKELHKIITKPESECDGYELHLRSRWKHNNAKSIFEITGLDVSRILTGPCTRDGVIVENPKTEGPTFYI